jgi:hypothetical protein
MKLIAKTDKAPETLILFGVANWSEALALIGHRLGGSGAL